MDTMKMKGKSVGVDPPVIAKTKPCFLWDVVGSQYIDWFNDTSEEWFEYLKSSSDTGEIKAQLEFDWGKNEV